MSHIGFVIKSRRLQRRLSRAKLAQGICSEKHIYLIEKGERSPSGQLMAQLGDRLETDLFGYFGYLASSDPVTVREILDDFCRWRRTGDYQSLWQATERCRNLPDFHILPWSGEILLNDWIYQALVEGKYPAVASEIIELEKINGFQGFACRVKAGSYCLLCLCQQVLGNLVQARESALRSSELCAEDQHPGNEELVTVTKLLNLSLDYLCGEYAEAIQAGRELLAFQESNNSYDRVHLTLFLLSFSYFKLGELLFAQQLFRSGVYCVLVRHRAADFQLLTKMEVFHQLLNSGVVCPETVAQLREKYPLEGS